MSKRKLEELINVKDDSWSFIEEWINNADNSCEVLKREIEKSKKVLLGLQVTTRSPLGSVAYRTGGILFDKGWIKLLGSGNSNIYGDLLYWNGIGENTVEESKDNALIIAYDIIGGFFALNGGAFSGELGDVFYLSPTTLEWEDLEVGYTDFLDWLFNGDLDSFYEDVRWDGWEKDIKLISTDKGIVFYPPLWSEEGTILTSMRKQIHVNEIWKLNLYYRKELGLV